MTTVESVARAHTATTAFQLKGSLFTLSVMQLYSICVDTIASQLSSLIKRSPSFFNHAPVVLDLHALVMTDTVIDFDSLANTLRQHKLVPVGVRGGTKQQHESAIASGFAVFPSSKSESDSSENNSPAEVTVPSRIQKGSKVITTPIRSGQQVYAQGGDLIVLSSVSHGAELLADGHIHVYGTLRGRALAGVTGDESAFIFCHELKADLVSIAGHYQVREHYRVNNDAGTYTRIFLNDGHLCIETVE